MQRNTGYLIITFLLLLVNAPNTAEAGIGACGDIDVEANASCEVITPGVSCDAKCTPLTFEAACAAQLTVDCDGECTASAEAGCDTGCLKDCLPDCTVDPGKFDCAATCRADCSGQCQAKCEASDDKTSCSASCKASCSAHCDGSCDVELPEANCDNKCAASCKGACKAKANVDCQVSCQSKGFATCETKLKGGCKADCKTNEGALFCDGQYIDHGGKLKECVDALRALVEVKGYAQGTSSCSGGTCNASGEAGVSSSCSALPGQPTRGSGCALALMVLGLAIGIVLNRKRSARRPE